MNNQPLPTMPPIPNQSPKLPPKPKSPLSISDKFIHSLKIIGISLGLLLIGLGGVVVLIGLVLTPFVDEELLELLLVPITAAAWAILIYITYKFVMPALKIPLNLSKPLKARDWAYVAIASIPGKIITGIIILVLTFLLRYNEDYTQFVEPNYEILTESGQTLFMLLSFFAVVIVIPITEEIMFRGVLYRGLRQKLSFYSTAIISSIIFALAHYDYTGRLDWQANLIIVFAILCLSLIISYVLEKTNNLWNCILIHSFNNLIAFFATILFIY